MRSCRLCEVYKLWAEYLNNVFNLVIMILWI